MSKANFLNVLTLPKFDGLPLAVTATRALELWSDLMVGVTKPAQLKSSERIDIMDECLDLVVPRADLPAGFEFVGMSLAQFRAALITAGRPGDERELWDRTFRSDAVESLRVAARSRIAIRAPLTLQYQHSFKLSPVAGRIADIDMPTALQRLCTAADAGWKKLRRNRLTVEVTEIQGQPNRLLPTRGKYVPARNAVMGGWWIFWDDQRLQPQPELGNVEYHELQLALPSLETSYFSDHFPVRNIFAHLRFSKFIDRKGRYVMLLDEVQSDWMRDLRWQRLGRAFKKRRTYVGERRPRVPAHIPECPLEKDWLDVAMNAFVDFAYDNGADVVAWVPGKIQAELNPGLPLVTAERLYDRRVARRLLKCLQHIESPATVVEYPTYRRNVLIQHHRRGWQLVRSDGKTKVSEPVTDREAVLQLHRIQAQPIVECLPALYLIHEDERSVYDDETSDPFNRALDRCSVIMQREIREVKA